MTPHDGFRLLLAMARNKKYGYFVFTSNVDGQFQKAGFRDDRIVECHGSIHYLQCSEPCKKTIWNASEFHPEIDEEHCRLTNTLPICPSCGSVARPNILMFDDWGFLHDRTEAQHLKLDEWLYRSRNIVTIEIGAGNDIATVRDFNERQGLPIIRINPREPEVHHEMDVGIKLNALAGLREIAIAI